VAKAETKNVKTLDETRKFEHGRMELVNIGGGSVGGATFEPGWR
jgi:hypothetical protein